MALRRSLLEEEALSANGRNPPAAALVSLIELSRKVAIMATSVRGGKMKTMSAKDAKNAFGLLLDQARAEPVTVEKHGRAVVVVLSVEEFERLSNSNLTATHTVRAA